MWCKSEFNMSWDIQGDTLNRVYTEGKIGVFQGGIYGLLTLYTAVSRQSRKAIWVTGNL